ncbi:PTS glucose transporter subunit IIA [Pseudoalteromonas tunicata]|uniref:PTS glucose transporter subunit IIA n=1 Tax=Pseudoalteromonas tunicata TaxID=314281 RepID=UPI00273D2199|nr:PTS glucose transporter subunit IIA [Pseudoalteromonas tunicata]MDP4982991.1 PTS glucose transporter subunit IIA [Pseudoalteromonas tunicata]MDP5211583.1 PTS glucose transporter subunit IIA [Pseudoalteromonas tunicata]
MSAIHRQVISANQNQLAGIGLPVFSPISGKILPLTSHPEALFSQGIMGCGLAMTLTGHKVFAPFDGSVEQIRAGGTEFILKSRQGIRMMIALSIATDYLPLPGLCFYVQEGQQFKAQDALFYADFRHVPQPIFAAITVLNHDKLGGIYYCLQQARAPQDILFHITARNKR